MLLKLGETTKNKLKCEQMADKIVSILFVIFFTSIQCFHYWVLYSGRPIFAHNEYQKSNQIKWLVQMLIKAKEIPAKDIIGKADEFIISTALLKMLMIVHVL